MTNRFAQVKETFSQEQGSPKPQAQRKKAAQASPKSYNKKGRFPFSLHHDVRYDKLEALVTHHKAKSASDYLEHLILKEWEKLQRRSK